MICAEIIIDHVAVITFFSHKRIVIAIRTCGESAIRVARCRAAAGRIALFSQIDHAVPAIFSSAAFGAIAGAGVAAFIHCSSALARAIATGFWNTLRRTTVFGATIAVIAKFPHFDNMVAADAVIFADFRAFAGESKATARAVGEAFAGFIAKTETFSIDITTIAVSVALILFLTRCFAITAAGTACFLCIAVPIPAVLRAAPAIIGTLLAAFAWGTACAISAILIISAVSAIGGTVFARFRAVACSVAAHFFLWAISAILFTACAGFISTAHGISALTGIDALAIGSAGIARFRAVAGSITALVSSAKFAAALLEPRAVAADKSARIQHAN